MYSTWQFQLSQLFILARCLVYMIRTCIHKHIHTFIFAYKIRWMLFISFSVTLAHIRRPLRSLSGFHSVSLVFILVFLLRGIFENASWRAREWARAMSYFTLFFAHVCILRWQWHAGAAVATHFSLANEPSMGWNDSVIQTYNHTLYTFIRNFRYSTLIFLN